MSTPESKSSPQQELAFIRECWFLAGATASGKSTVSLPLAQQLDAEIISLDSMAIYQGMDIGTAKPTSKQQLTVPHHLLDIVSPDQSYSVSQFRDAAHQTIREIRERGKQVLFVGGTALYLQALIKGIFEGPPADWEFRAQVEAELEQAGGDALHQRLAMFDPLSADKLHPNDTRRIIRALEVLHVTGRPISHLQREFERSMKPDQCRVFWLRRPRPELHERIESRVERMFADGLVAEVQGLLDRYGSLSHSAMQAVGYKEVIAHLKGEYDLAEAVEQVKIRSRRFARGQETWFRNMDESRVLDRSGDFDIAQTVNEIQELGAELEPLT